MPAGVRESVPQNSSIPLQGTVRQGVSAARADGQSELQSGTGGLRHRMVGVGNARQAEALRVGYAQTQGEMEHASYGAPYYHRNDLLWDREDLEVHIRDQRLFQELQNEVAVREGSGARELARPGELLCQLEEFHAVNASLQEQESAGELKRSDDSRDDFFQAARALGEQPKISSSEWMLRNSAMKLADAKALVVALETKIQEATLPGEERANLQTRLEQRKADVAKWESRLEVLHAHMKGTDNAGAARAEKTPVALGVGDERGATLGWAARAKAAFKTFFSPLFNGLQALRSLAVGLSSRIWSGLTGGPSLNDQLIARLEKMIHGGSLPYDDAKAASISGNARHICNGMAKDIPRVDIFIGGKNLRVPTDKPESTEEKRARERLLVEDTATALLAECGGNEALCMRVSNFAFQAMDSFWGLAAQERLLSPQGVPSAERYDFPHPKHHWIEVKNQGEEGVQLIFHAKNPGIEVIARVNDTPQGPEASPVELDPERSAFSGRFSIIVRADLSVEPFTLSDGTAGGTPVSYEYYVSPIT